MLELVESHYSFGGTQAVYKHFSRAVGVSMRFSVYLPPQASSRKVPALFYLAGLTCTEETFPIKAGAQRYASEHGIALISPDTSPRDTGIPYEKNSWEFGAGAGFYVDATEAPWNKHFRMYSYVRDELRELVLEHFDIDGNALGIFGHSMGGHGALVLALRNPEIYKSVSAFAPIAAPTICDWGQGAFSGYLGKDTTTWKAYDASELVQATSARFPDGILVDQGLDDKFLAEKQLNPEVFEAACRAAAQPLTLRKHEGYDHGYFFISTYMQDHIEHHSRVLHRHCQKN
ncbi:S-formylglutathione hydrolase [Paraburkholderia fungorum]|jgi:S-formylglutathione hydrolase|uniref:S-formylglutathione hydrolase n=1 Tax=Paraburkholderia fungorum TaxID=134537 RepID=UPI00162298AD|nr:S-formylglutathione hydrolase [Paraburkholderia fungorum]MBB4519729.1 S-formylglutathione hydrolase [Paraburkholderia fungorum]